jgi:cell filamentation protein
VTFQPDGLLIKGSAVLLRADQIEATLTRALKDLRARNHFRGLSRDEFAQQGAVLFNVINHAHAFREGNGRTQRLFISQLAEGAGHSLEWGVVSQERMISTSIDGRAGDDAPMQRLFREISDSSKVKMLQGAIEFLERERINWNERYIAASVTGQEYSGTVAASSRSSAIIFTDAQQVIVTSARDVIESDAEKRVRFTAGR